MHGHGLEAAALSGVVTAQAALDPDRVVLVVDRGDEYPQTLTAAALAQDAQRVAAAFYRGGLRAGARIGLLMPNCSELASVLVACCKLGLTVVPIPTRRPSDQLAAVARSSGCAAVVVSDQVIGKPRRTGSQVKLGLPVWIHHTGSEVGRGRLPRMPWPTLNEVLESPATAVPEERTVDPGVTLLAPHPEGREGPRSLSHGALLAHRRLPQHFGYEPADVIYTELPMTDPRALVAVLSPALDGAVRQAVFSREFAVQRLWATCIDHGATIWCGTGTTAQALYALYSSAADRTHFVRLAVTTGMPKEIWRTFQARFGVGLLEWYFGGDTALAFNPVGIGPAGSFGKAPDGAPTLDVIDGAGGSVAPGTIGELAVRTDGDPLLPAAWRRTGDLVSRDEHGWLYHATPRRSTLGPPAISPLEEQHASAERR